MSRVLKMMSIAVVLFLAYMWISVLTKSCNRDKEEQIKIPETNQNGDELPVMIFFAEEGDTSLQTADPVDYKEIDETIEKTVEKTKTGGQSIKEDEVGTTSVPVKPMNDSQKPPTTKATEGNVPANKTNPEKPVLKPKAPVVKASAGRRNQENGKDAFAREKTTTAPTSSTAAVSGGSGGYIVVAGNYLVEGNANAMLQKLKKAGFSNAEKVVLMYQNFIQLLQVRYPSEEAAVKTINNLKSKGIDAYLHRKK